jgi:hypothetical protein
MSGSYTILALDFTRKPLLLLHFPNSRKMKGKTLLSVNLSLHLFELSSKPLILVLAVNASHGSAWMK